MTTLLELFERQRDLQLVMPPRGRTPYDLDGEERTHFIMWNVVALTDELHEMLQEVGWKEWASSRHVNEEAALGELVDALHFFMNLVMAVAPRGESLEETVEKLVDAYERKVEVNRRRQEESYDGVTGKCPGCHRDLAEVGVQQVIPDQGPPLEYCAGCARVLT